MKLLFYARPALRRLTGRCSSTSAPRPCRSAAALSSSPTARGFSSTIASRHADEYPEDDESEGPDFADDALDSDGAEPEDAYKPPVPPVTFVRSLMHDRRGTRATPPPGIGPFMVTHPDKRVVPVQPDPHEVEKFGYTLLKRSRKLYNTEAIISGGTSGIGFAIAQRLASEGVVCTLFGRHEPRLRLATSALPPVMKWTGEPDAGESESSSPPKPKPKKRPGQEIPNPNFTPAPHRYFLGDVCDPVSWRELFRQTPDATFLINAAGITYRSLLAIFPADEIQKIYDINLYGTTIGCRAALRAWAKSHKPDGPFSKKEDRCIVNISSIMAEQGGYGTAAYAASKAGVVALTRALSLEAANRSIRCNVVLPGYIQTRMTENLRQEDTVQKIAVKRLGRPDEVADAVAFLLKNKYANNCSLNLDGGMGSF